MLSSRIGALFPCNVIVWEEEPSVQRVYHVSIVKLARVVGTAPDSEEWQSIADDTGELVADAFERLEAS